MVQSVAPFKKTIDFFCIFITGKSENRYLREKEPDLLLQGHLVKSGRCLMQSSAPGKGWAWEEPRVLQLRLEPQRGQGGAPGRVPGAFGAELQLLLLAGEEMKL